jgi:ribosomal-protein-alanine N-acetyltransferase
MIRVMRPADFDAIAAIEAQKFSTAFDLGSLSVLFNKEAFCGFVDVFNTPNTMNKPDKPAILSGYLLAMIMVDEAEILSIAVRSDHQKRGRGAGLLGHFLAHIAAQGVETVLLEVAADNVPALSLYHRHGFAEFGRRIAYYNRSDGRCDAIMMRRECG